MEVSIINIKGKDTGRKAVLADSIYKIEPSEHAVYLDVKQYLANQRQGTHKTKERAEVDFSTKKIKKQKGTGGARAGSRKSPVFVGGGTIFGPRPRDYGFKLNKKLKALARKSVLTTKAKDKKISIIEDFTLKAPKTSEYVKILDSLSLRDKKILVVLSEKNDNIYLSSRNLTRSKVVTVDELNTYDLLNADTLVLAEGSVKKIEDLLN